MAIYDNDCRVTANGPNYLRGKLSLREGESVLEDTRIALCRCGASQHKPFCDNSHKKIGFIDAGTFPVGASAPAGADLSAPLDIRLMPNGPVVCGPAHAAWQRWAHRVFRNDVPLPLRRLAQQTVLRRHAQEDRLR